MGRYCLFEVLKMFFKILLVAPQIPKLHGLKDMDEKQILFEGERLIPIFEGATPISIYVPRGDCESG